MSQFRELEGDLWSFVLVGNVVCITTNGQIKKDGRAVMGRGVALQAREKFPGIDKRLGELIEKHGTRCVRLPMGMTVGNGSSEWTLVAYPVKYHWRDKANLELIETSAQQLVAMANKFQWDNIYLPRPGTGAGQLTWAEVLLSGALDILDDRFTIVYNGPEEPV